MMRRIFSLSLAALLLLALAVFGPKTAHAAQTVKFEPVRAPSRGPDNAPVTIVEIADFM